MLVFNQLVDGDHVAALASLQAAVHSVELTFHERTKGRLRIKTTLGVEAGIQIERGLILQDGQMLQADSGEYLKIEAKDEMVSVASAASQHLFARACYHVGNRHAEVEIGESQLKYLRDHVMDEMLRRLGLDVCEESLPFQPENGAYAKGHSHSHSHSHSHEHEHEHEHEHGH